MQKSFASKPKEAPKDQIEDLWYDFRRSQRLGNTHSPEERKKEKNKKTFLGR